MVAGSCLFLAAKVYESNVTCDAVVDAVQTLLSPTQFSVLGTKPKVHCPFHCNMYNTYTGSKTVVLTQLLAVDRQHIFY